MEDSTEYKVRLQEEELNETEAVTSEETERNVIKVPASADDIHEFSPRSSSPEPCASSKTNASCIQKSSSSSTAFAEADATAKEPSFSQAAVEEIQESASSSSSAAVAAADDLHAPSPRSSNKLRVTFKTNESDIQESASSSSTAAAASDEPSSSQAAVEERQESASSSSSAIAATAEESSSSQTAAIEEQPNQSVKRIRAKPLRFNDYINYEEEKKKSRKRKINNIAGVDGSDEYFPPLRRSRTSACIIKSGVTLQSSGLNSKTNETEVQCQSKRIRTRTSRYSEYIVGEEEKLVKKSNRRSNDTVLNGNPSTSQQRSRTVTLIFNNSVERSGSSKTALADIPSKPRTNSKTSEESNRRQRTRTRTSRFYESTVGEIEKELTTKRKRKSNDTEANGTDGNLPASNRSRTVTFLINNNNNVKRIGGPKIVYDCKIEGVEKIFGVNKELLSQKSKGFADLFSVDSEKSFYELEGIPDRTLEAVFNFCHGKPLKDNMNNREFNSLLFYSHTFEIAELKVHCEEKLVERIAPTTVVDIANAGCSAKSEILRNICKTYMIENIQNNESLRNFAALNKELKDEIFAATVSHSSQSL